MPVNAIRRRGGVARAAPQSISAVGPGVLCTLSPHNVRNLVWLPLFLPPPRLPPLVTPPPPTVSIKASHPLRGLSRMHSTKISVGHVATLFSFTSVSHADRRNCINISITPVAQASCLIIPRGCGDTHVMRDFMLHVASTLSCYRTDLVLPRRSMLLELNISYSPLRYFTLPGTDHVSPPRAPHSSFTLTSAAGNVLYYTSERFQFSRNTSRRTTNQRATLHFIIRLSLSSARA